MKDAMGAQVLGGTKWKRFALVMVPTIGIAGAMTVAMAQGAIAASIDISGTAFQVSADSLHGTHFYQTGTVLRSKAQQDPAHPGGTAVAEAGISSATITNMCQSVKVPTPFGNLVVVLRAGRSAGSPVEASNLVLDASQIDASSATFKGVSIGVDAGELADGSKGTTVITGFAAPQGAFGQSVDDAQLDNVKQTAYSTIATELSLKGLSISANFNGDTCF